MNPLFIDFLIQTGINTGLSALAMLTQNPAQAAAQKSIIQHFVQSACALYGWTVNFN